MKEWTGGVEGLRGSPFLPQKGKTKELILQDPNETGSHRGKDSGRSAGGGEIWQQSGEEKGMKYSTFLFLHT